MMCIKQKKTIPALQGLGTLEKWAAMKDEQSGEYVQLKMCLPVKYPDILGRTLHTEYVTCTQSACVHART